MPQWNTTERGKTQEDQFTTSYGQGKGGGGGTDYDGKSCSDHHQLPGRGIRDVEDLTMLSGLAHYDDDES